MVTVDTVGAATAPLLLDSATTSPPAGAAHSSVSDPATAAPPVTGFGESVSVFTRIGRTVNASAFDTPAKLAVTVPFTLVLTVLVVMVNVCEDAPAGIVTL